MAEFIHSRSVLDQWTSLFFLQQLLDVLAYLRRKNILHEDIKGVYSFLPLSCFFPPVHIQLLAFVSHFPADNIFLKPDSYTIGLGDFGLSRRGPCPQGEKPLGGTLTRTITVSPLRFTEPEMKFIVQFHFFRTAPMEP